MSDMRMHEMKQINIINIIRFTWAVIEIAIKNSVKSIKPLIKINKIIKWSKINKSIFKNKTNLLSKSNTLNTLI